MSKQASVMVTIGVFFVFFAGALLSASCQQSSSDNATAPAQCSPSCSDMQICCYRHEYALANPDGGAYLYPPGETISYDPVCAIQVDGGYGINALLDGSPAICSFEPTQ